MRFVSFVIGAVLAMLFIDPLAAHALTVGLQHAASPHSGLIRFLELSAGVGIFGATLSTGALTLADWAKRKDPNGKIAAIIELLSQTNEILTDMLWIEGNLETGNRTTVRTGLPAVAWRLLNQGVATSKSTTAQIDENCGMLEAWSEVDVDLAKLNGDINAFRMSEAGAFIEAMNQEMAQTLFYGNSGLAPEEFLGLSPRYSSLSASVANSANVISAAGVQSDNASIWLIVWGANTVAGIYPKGSSAGLQHNDYGETTVEMTTGIGGSRMRAFQERWQWKAGLMLKDWRYAVRICNIDISNLVAKSSAADLTELMIRAYHRIPTLGLGKPAFYMNRTVYEFLDIQRRDDIQTGGGFTYANIDGVARPTFRGIPVNKVDALLESEAVVS